MERLRRVRDHVVNPVAGGDDTDVDVEAAINTVRTSRSARCSGSLLRLPRR